MFGGSVDVARMDGGQCAMAAALGEHCKPDRDCGRKGFSPADDFTATFGLGGEMRDWEKTGALPEIIAFESDGAAGLDCEESVGDGFGFNGLEEGESVVSSLGVHADGGVGDGSELGLPCEVRAAEDVSGAVVVFVADFDESGFEGIGDCFEGEEAEGMSEFFSDRLNKRKVVRRSNPDLIRFRIEASDMSSLGDCDRTISEEWVRSIICHSVASLGSTSRV